MERMVPEVQYLEDRGYFSKAEVRALIQARLDFEYKLRAKAPDKEAFWRCGLSYMGGIQAGCRT